MAGSVAQLVEQATFNREVPGSSPGGPTTGVSYATGERLPCHRGGAPSDEPARAAEARQDEQIVNLVVDAG